jgi:hypothetical protein
MTDIQFATMMATMNEQTVAVIGLFLALIFAVTWKG